MPKVKEWEGGIAFIDEIPNGVRVFVSIIGLIPMILVPYELLLRPGWEGFSLFMIMPIVISIGGILVGSFFVAAGLFGLNQTLVFRKKDRSIVYSHESALVPLSRRKYKFSDVASAEIIPRDGSDGPTTYGLQFIFNNGRKVETGSFEDGKKAEHYLSLIKRLIH